MPDHLTDRAAAIGRDNGRAAAAWIFDGNTTDDTCRRMLADITACDPQILDTYSAPALSGEYADDYGEDDLAADLGLDPRSVGYAGELDVACSAYLEAASDEFWSEIERAARGHLQDAP